MKKILCMMFFIGALFTTLQPAVAIAPYPIDYADVVKIKAVTDDPRPFLTDSQFYKIWIPDEAWKQITFDQAEMKKLWAEVVGFKAPDAVGKTVPEIKPGKYTLSDKTRYPFDRLLPSFYYNKWNNPGEGGFNHIGYYTEFEIIPTRQYGWSIPIAEATLKHMHLVKQDDEGYMTVDSTYGGYPFPRPSGKHRGIQLLYNWERRYVFGEDAFAMDLTRGVDKNWNIDHTGLAVSSILRVAGRITEPVGYMDELAKKNSQLKLWLYSLREPRDFYGNVYLVTMYTDPDKSSGLLAYVNMLRRIRKLSSSDKQDQAVGQDIAFDDADGFSQAISPKHYPYDYTVIEDREFLAPALTEDGSEYIDTKDQFKWKGLRFERRPVLVLEMKQRDPNYIYSKRIIYFDKETLMPFHFEYYDQKNRLYRSFAMLFANVKPMGILSPIMAVSADHIDVHSTFSFVPSYPALWLDRNSVSLVKMVKTK